MTIHEEVFKFLDEAFDRNLYSAIYTIPGLGGGYVGQLYANEKKYNYINNPSYEIKDRNIVNLDLLNRDNIKLYNEILAQAQNQVPNKVCSFVINNSSLFNKDNQAEFQRHIYQTFWMRAKTPEETESYIKELKSSLPPTQLQKVYELSGGIPRLVKFLCASPELINKNIEQICSNDTLKSLIQTTIETIKATNHQILTSMHLKYNNDWKSSIIGFFMKAEKPNKVNIMIKPDLSFMEDNEASKAKLTVTEKAIMELFIEKNTVSRDEISMVKWGKNEDEKFSYWAINKTITRLNSKLEKYIIKPLYKSGYTLSPRKDT